MNTNYFTFILEYPGVFIGDFLIAPLASVVFAYAIVRWLVGKKFKVANVNSWETLLGILITDVISALTRFFAWRGAWEASAHPGKLELLYLLISAIVAYAYLKFKAKEKSGPTKFAEPNPEVAKQQVVDDPMFAKVAKGIVRKEIDQRLWDKAISFNQQRLAAIAILIFLLHFCFHHLPRHWLTERK